MKKYLSIICLIFSITSSTHIISMEMDDKETIIDFQISNKKMVMQRIASGTYYTDSNVLAIIKFLTNFWGKNGAIEDLNYWDFTRCSTYLSQIFEALAKRKTPIDIPSDLCKKAFDMTTCVKNREEKKLRGLSDKFLELYKSNLNDCIKNIQGCTSGLKAIKKQQSDTSLSIPKPPVLNTIDSEQSTTPENLCVNCR